eukprot:361330-Chlamydomonas_euryale.AAC.3
MPPTTSEGAAWHPPGLLSTFGKTGSSRVDARAFSSLPLQVEAKTKEIDTETHLRALAERETVCRGVCVFWGWVAGAAGV